METLTAAGTTAIIPALNEAAAIGGVVQGLLLRGIGRVVVVDGGSSDGTDQIALAAGACVVAQGRRGYGNACMAGAAAASEAATLLFLDGDGAEDLDGAIQVVRCVLDGRAQVALGARVVRQGEEGAQTVLARLGNCACSWWLRAVFRAPVTDFASMKAVSQQVYQRLHLDNQRYGWTAQFIARAARQHLSIVEVPVTYRRRAGRSKVSGSVAGALQAGLQMLTVLGDETAGAALTKPSRDLLDRLRAVCSGLPSRRKARITHAQ